MNPSVLHWNMVYPLLQVHHGIQSHSKINLALYSKGWGIGIDRLCMLLCNRNNIKVHICDIIYGKLMTDIYVYTGSYCLSHIKDASKTTTRVIDRKKNSKGINDGKLLLVIIVSYFNLVTISKKIGAIIWELV